VTHSGYGRFLDKTAQQWVDAALAEGELEFIVHPKCRVCQSENIRHLVNKLITRGFTVPDMLEVLESHNVKLEKQGEPKITRDILYRHRREHFDIQSPTGAILRRIQEEAAKDYGQDWEEGVGTILNSVSYHQTMMMKGYETLIDPRTKITPEMGAKSADRLHDILAASADQYDRARLQADMGRVIEVMRSFVPSERWPAMQAALRGEHVDSEIEDAEEVEMIAILDADPEE
jgi:hypothetical protein